MTIQELWEWAQAHDCLHLPILISFYDREGLWMGNSVLRHENLTTVNDCVVLEGDER